MQTPTKPIRLMAGRSNEIKGAWSGYDGERRLKVGQIFTWYDAKLPSWARMQNAEGQWVDIDPKTREARIAAVKRAHPSTLPGQAPTKRIHRLERDEAKVLRQTTDPDLEGDEEDDELDTDPDLEGDGDGEGEGEGEGTGSAEGEGTTATPPATPPATTPAKGKGKSKSKSKSKKKAPARAADQALE